MTGLPIRSLIYSAVVSLACFMAGRPANTGADEQGNAQQVDGQKMRAFLFSEVHKNLVSKVVATIPPTVFKACPSLVSNGSNVKQIGRAHV